MTARNRKAAIFSAAFGLVAVVFLALLLTGTLQRAFATSPDSVANPDRIHYYAEDTDGCRFGTDVLAEAKKMVEDGKASSVQDAIFHVDENGKVTGILYDRMYHDPALTGAITVEILEREEIGWYTILGSRYKDFENIEIGRLADQLHLAFLEDYDFWDQVIANDLNLLKSGKVEIVELSDYTSSMYMIVDALQGDKPSVVVRNSTNVGGHAIVFTVGKAGTYRFRLECGFQPVNPGDYWPVPEGEDPVPDTPDDPGTGDPDPELDQKDPNAGPQAQTGGNNPNYGGGQNQDNDTTVTDEPSSPSTYTPPARPSGDTGSSGTGGTGGSQSQSGSPTVDHDNGTHETHGGQDYQVQAGDGQNHTDLGTVQEQASHDTVEAPVQDDGVNEGDILPPE